MRSRIKEYLVTNQPFRVLGKSFRNIFMPVRGDKIEIFEAFIEVSSICNAKCIFCNYKFGYRKKSLMEIDTFKKIAREYYNLGAKKLNLTSIGGELFTHPRAIEVFQIAREIGYESINLYTNAILLYKFDLDELLRVCTKPLSENSMGGQVYINISFPAFDKDSYEKVYGVNKFDEFLKSVLLLLEANAKSERKIKITFEPRTFYKREELIQSKIFKEKIEKYIDENVVIGENIKKFDSWGGEIKKKELIKGIKLDLVALKSIYPLKNTYLCNKLSSFGVLANGDVRLCNCRYDKTLHTEQDILFIANLKNYKDLKDLLISNEDKINKIRNNFINGKMSDLCKKCTFYFPVEYKDYSLKVEKD